MPKPKTALAWIEISIAIAAIIAAIGYGAYRATQPVPLDRVGCTEEAKLCPNGSYVSRIGPRCEFAPCTSFSPSPEPTLDTSGSKTYRNEQYGFEVKYPENWSVRTEIGGDNIFRFYKTSDLDTRIRVSVTDRPENIEGFAEIKMRKRTEVDGVAAEKLLGGFYAAEGQEWIVQIEHGSFYYLVYGNGYNTEQEEIFDQFLSTFKFIK